jgi:hypothetical protein
MLFSSCQEPTTTFLRAFWTFWNVQIFTNVTFNSTFDLLIDLSRDRRVLKNCSPVRWGTSCKIWMKSDNIEMLTFLRSWPTSDLKAFYRDVLQRFYIAMSTGNVHAASFQMRISSFWDFSSPVILGSCPGWPRSILIPQSWESPKLLSSCLEPTVTVS